MSDAVDLLKSIDATLKQIAKLLAAGQPKPVADDRDLDGKYGDPELKFLPRAWDGEDFKGCHFSECPAELLDLVAETLDYFGEQADAKGEKTTGGKPVGDYKRLDAARARGWAKRVRAGHQPPARAAGAGWADDEPAPADDNDVPF